MQIAIRKKSLHILALKITGLKCNDCARQDKGAMKISESTVKALKFIIWAEPKKIFSFEMSDDAKKELKLLSKIYLDKSLEREYN